MKFEGGERDRGDSVVPGVECLQTILQNTSIYIVKTVDVKIHFEIFGKVPTYTYLYISDREVSHEIILDLWNLGVIMLTYIRNPYHIQYILTSAISSLHQRVTFSHDDLVII